jgi:CRISPR/Cas system endoribonuclease Cas6 (RAMP superfamily)
VDDVTIAVFAAFDKNIARMLPNSRRLLMYKEKNEPYRAYLLRCWQEGDIGTDQEPLWRFSVEDVFGERRWQGFGSLEALVAFLRVEFTRCDRK